jgi:HEPN domain-containing protein
VKEKPFMSGELDIARQWIVKARNDLIDADNNLAAMRIPCDTVCFHCQQAAEKLLKAVLAAKGVSPPLTHDLLRLLEMIIPFAPSAENLRNWLVILMPYSVTMRYPDDDGLNVPSLEDTREARQCADCVLNWLSREFPEIFTDE